MGYMGFGMRKEDYTRKPKKGFVKRKELERRKLPSKTYSKASDEPYENKYIHQPKAAVLVLVMLIALSVIIVVSLSYLI